MLNDPKQRGISSVMVVVLLALALLLLAIPLWIHDKNKTARELAHLAEVARNAPPKSVPTTALQASTASRPIGYGLSFAVVPSSEGTPADVVHLGCHGEPRDLARPHEGSCNPYQGDTSCRVALPVLCFKQDGSGPPAGVESSFYQGWTRGSLAATPPVMGALLESEASASARCARELGDGWRMAEFHDGGGGWGLQGRRGAGFGAWTRYWVHINDQPGNCWNSKP